MAVAKVILNGTTLIDTTQKTVQADKMVASYTALDKAGESITGSIASKTSSDLTANNLTVTAPSGYYASSATKTLTDANLVTSNIKKDVSIFGVTGSYEGGGGGGLEYETGSWTPSEDVARGEISFTNTHTDAPFFVEISDQTGTYDSTTNSNYEMAFVSWTWVFGSGMYFSSAGQWFAGVRYSYRGTGTTQLLANYVNIIKESGNTNYQYPGYWVDNEKFYPYTDSTSRYWRAGRTYKWIAVWEPTT